MKENVYVAFLDLKRAFASVQKYLLFYNLQNEGFYSKMYFALRSQKALKPSKMMYSFNEFIFLRV